MNISVTNNRQPFPPLYTCGWTSENEKYLPGSSMIYEPMLLFTERGLIYMLDDSSPLMRTWQGIDPSYICLLEGYKGMMTPGRHSAQKELRKMLLMVLKSPTRWARPRAYSSPHLYLVRHEIKAWQAQQELPQQETRHYSSWGGKMKQIRGGKYDVVPGLWSFKEKVIISLASGWCFLKYKWSRKGHYSLINGI